MAVQNRSRTPRRLRVEEGIYCNPATGRLEIQWTDETGRTRWRTIHRGGVEEARRARDQAQQVRRSFCDVAEEWLRSQTRIRQRTFEGYAGSLDRHVFPRIGNRAIASINENDLVALIKDLEERGLAAWTIRGILVPINRVMEYALRRKMVEYNPVRRLDRHEKPRLGKREPRILRSEEIAALLRATIPTYRPVLATAIFTGLRMRELLGLRWADVDLKDGTIRVRRQLDRTGQYTEPKTPAALRTIVLTPPLLELLREHKRKSSWSLPGHPVFATETGQPMHYRNITRRGLQAAMDKTGLNADHWPRLRFHDLRHTYASLLIAQGANIIFVSRQLGHVYPSFTLNTYAALFDAAEYGQQVADGLAGAFPANLTPPPQTFTEI